MGEEFVKKMLKSIKGTIKVALKPILIPVLCIISVIVLLAACVYFITTDDGTYKEGDWASPMFAANQYTNSVTVGEDGKLSSEYTAQELWDKLKSKNSRVVTYLKDSKELAKLMNAEVITQYPDTRVNPDAKIDWSTVLNPDEQSLQGIIKFKRNIIEGNYGLTKDMLEEFKKEYEQYKKEKEEKDRKEEEKREKCEYSVKQNDDGSYDIGNLKSIKIESLNGELNKYAQSGEKIAIRWLDSQKIKIGEKTIYAPEYNGNYTEVENIIYDLEGKKENQCKVSKDSGGNYNVEGVVVSKDSFFGKTQLSKLTEKNDMITISVDENRIFKIGNANVAKGRANYDEAKALYEKVRAAILGEKDIKSNTTDFEQWLNEKGYSKDANSDEWKKNSKNITMTYATPEEFRNYIEEYKKTGSQEAKEKALSHFTIEKNTSSSSSSVAKVGSLDNFLFIGDSMTVGISQAASDQAGLTLKETNKQALNSVTYKAEIGVAAKYWLQHFSELPDAGQVKGVCLLLGVNNTSDTTSMRELIDKLAEKYSNTNIYVQRVFSVGQAYTKYYGRSADGMNEAISAFNRKIKEYCDGKDKVYYIDTTSGYIDSNGYLPADMSSDGLHFSEYDKMVENISSQIVEISGNSDEKNNDKKEDKNDKDKEYVVKVATWNETSTSYETNIPGESSYAFTQYDMTEQTINYYDMVKAYTMPFNYLWDLLVVSEDRDFVLELANLVYNSEIVITVNDNLTTTKDVTVHSYQERRKTTSNLNAILGDGGRYSDSGSKEEIVTYTSTKTVITRTNTLDIALTRANVWIVDYSKDYEYEKGEASIQGSTTDLGNVSNAETNQQDPLGLASGVGNHQEIQISTTVSSQIKDNMQENTGIIQTTKFISNVSKVREKTEKIRLKKSEIGPDGFKYKEKNFVTLLVSNSKAKRNILNAASWLFEMLETEENNLTDMVDLTKYLLYKATGVDYGITEFDFSIFEPGSFNSIDGIYGGNAQEKVWYALRKAGFSEEASAGVLGNIQNESGFDPSLIEGGSGIGFGLIQWSFGRRTQMEAYAASKGASASDIDIQIEFLIAELTPGGGAGGHASYQLSGQSSSAYDGRSYNANDFKNASTPETASVAFMALFERPSYDPSINHMDRRKADARKYYEEFKGRSLDSFEGGKITNVENSPNYCQWAEPWGQMRFGAYTIANTGCGPTSAAIAITTLTGKRVTPDQTCGYAYSQGLYNSGSTPYGSGPAASEACARKWGLNAKSTDSIDEVEQALKNGKAVVAPLTGTVFYGGAHSVCLLGYKDGNTFVRDPNHPENPGSQWHSLRNYIWPHKCLSFTIIG